MVEVAVRPVPQVVPQVVVEVVAEVQVVVQVVARLSGQVPKVEGHTINKGVVIIIRRRRRAALGVAPHKRATKPVWIISIAAEHFAGVTSRKSFVSDS